MALECILRPILLLFFLTFLLHFISISSLSESEALIKLKSSFTNSASLQSWVPGSFPCQPNAKWFGLSCSSNGAVTGLRLENMGLSGNIDVDALIEMPVLRSISFSNNSFSGRIPDLNRLGLRAMYLSRNQFSGEIPSDFFSKMGMLKKVSLSDNQFAGKIPSSLSQLSNLIELHLQNNQFSGAIPDIKQTSLKIFNVSNNKLEGKIPPDLSRFNSSSFQGNAKLCIEDCNGGATPPPSPAAPKPLSLNKRDLKKTIAGMVTLAVLLLSVVAVILIRLRNKAKDEDDDTDNNNNANEAVEIQVSLPITRMKETQSPSPKRAGPIRKGSNQGKGGAIGELILMNAEKGTFGMPDLMKAAAEVLGNGQMGSSYKAALANGMEIVVKRIREMNELGKDGFEAEVRKLGKLRHPNILPPLAFHYRKEEKLLIYEYIPKGSLLYLLHGERKPPNSDLDWPARLKIVRGIAKGLLFIYTELGSSELVHGNLKSSNVLIGPDNEALLSEFGFWPLISRSTVKQVLFAYKAPEATTSGASPKCDVYCLGIVILEILTGKFPAQYLNSSSGGIDLVQWVESAISEGKEEELLDPDITRSTSSNSISEMKQLLKIGFACTESDPGRRIAMSEAIQRIQEIKLQGDVV